MTRANVAARYSALVMADSPACYLKGGYGGWPGTVVGWWTDSSGNNRHSTAGAGTQLATQQTPLMPWMETSFGMNGNTDPACYMEFSGNPVSTAGDYSVELWFKRLAQGRGGNGASGVNGYGTLVSKGGNAANDHLIYEDRDSHTVVGFNDTSTQNYCGDGVLALNAVNYIVWTVTGTTSKIYRNGVLQNTITLASGARGNTGNWRLGLPVNNWFGCPGGLYNHVAWYSTVLTPEKILQRWLTATRGQASY